MKIKYFWVLILSPIFLTGCLNLEDPKVFVEPYEVEFSDTLQENPSKVCNAMSEGNTILINTPCNADSVNASRIKIEGETVESNIKLNLNILQNGVSIHSEELSLVPDSAASGTKNISSIITLVDEPTGNVDMVISSLNDSVTLKLKLN